MNGTFLVILRAVSTISGVVKITVLFSRLPFCLIFYRILIRKRFVVVIFRFFLKDAEIWAVLCQLAIESMDKCIPFSFLICVGLEFGFDLSRHENSRFQFLQLYLKSAELDF